MSMSLKTEMETAPWYGDDVIPAEIFTNPEQGANLDKKWVRKKEGRITRRRAKSQRAVHGRWDCQGDGDGFDNSKAYLVLERCVVP